jgi:hypothetical protein
MLKEAAINRLRMAPHGAAVTAVSYESSKTCDKTQGFIVDLDVAGYNLYLEQPLVCSKNELNPRFSGLILHALVQTYPIWTRYF